LVPVEKKKNVSKSSVERVHKKGKKVEGTWAGAIGTGSRSPPQAGTAVAPNGKAT